ncbi:MAG: hypothetical protein JSS72_02355 [Armatimonadetes bacterium]|nr:hypothetical protein [Armatimonadota bacterium]
MKSRLFTGIAVFGLAATMVAQNLDYKFKSTEGGFSVKMPGKPVFSTGKNTYDGSTVKIYSSITLTRMYRAFYEPYTPEIKKIIAHVNWHDTNNAEVKRLFDTAIPKMLKSFPNAKVVYSNDGVVDGFPSRAAVIESSGKRVYLEFLITKKSIIGVFVGADAADRDLASIQEFLDTLHVI